MEEAFFDVNNLDKLARIDEHMDFIEKLATKYGDPSQDAVESGGDWRRIHEQLSLVRKKRNDKKLNISVIGEFSTGKSTFINALLRNELLVSSALQGTTVASTQIDYNKHYRICLEYLNGRKDKELRYSNFEDLKEHLSGYTTNPKLSRTLKKVSVGLPSEILKKHFRIIDTPGTNVTEAWHEDVTVRTLEQDSDLSIVLISAERPVPETMLKFVEKNLSSILPQCVFVVTKLDLIRKREREGLLSYIKMKLEEELELRNAVVLPYVSPLFFEGRGNEADSSELLALSAETERKLLEHTARQRTLAVTKKLTALIDTGYGLVSENMENISRAYKEKLELLNRSKTADLSDFVRRERSKRLQSFDRTLKNGQNDFEEKLHGCASSEKKGILGKLDEKTSLDQLSQYINNTLGGDCSQGAKNIISQVNDYYAKIRVQFEEEIGAFKKAFKANYETLNILPVDMSSSKYALPGDIPVDNVNISSSANYIAEQLAKENRTVLGGAAAGAAVGTAIAPGIGTVIGGIIGFVVGAGKGPDVSKVRGECKTKLSSRLDGYYSNICNKTVSSAEAYGNKIRTCLDGEMNRYLERYYTEVDRQIAGEKSRKAGVESKLAGLEADRRLIRNRKEQLESVIVQLNSLGKKED